MASTIHDPNNIIDLTSRFAPGDKFDLNVSKVVRSGKHVYGILKSTVDIPVGQLYQLLSDLRPATNRAIFNVYSWNSGLLLVNRVVWIDSQGYLQIYGNALDGNTCVLIDYIIN